MGLYPIDCSQCKKPFMWFSGNLDSRCPDCVKKFAVNPHCCFEQCQGCKNIFELEPGCICDQLLDQVDRKVNQTPLACGHKPCTLGGCKSCDKHCGKGKQK